MNKKMNGSDSSSGLPIYSPLQISPPFLVGEKHSENFLCIHVLCLKRNSNRQVTLFFLFVNLAESVFFKHMVHYVGLYLNIAFYIS